MNPQFFDVRKPDGHFDAAYSHRFFNMRFLVRNQNGFNFFSVRNQNDGLDFSAIGHSHCKTCYL
jgi:hypothetical protein